MMRKIKDGMISDKVSQRILWLTIVFFIAFFGITILSYYLLPEGFLLRKNRISDFKTSENFFLCTAQIFLYNILSVAFIFVGSMFAKRNEGEKAYRSYGRIGFFCVHFAQCRYPGNLVIYRKHKQRTPCGKDSADL